MKLIDKDALVVEIERIKEMYCYDTKTNASFVAEAVINSINNAINSIEVKEVDLQEEPKTDWLRELQERLDSLSKDDFKKVWDKYSKYGKEDSVDYDKLNTMLDESLSKETKESWNKRLGEETVSDYLKTEIDKYIIDNFTVDREVLIRLGIVEKDYIYSLDRGDMLALVEHFINWQKEQFEKNRLAACDRQTEEEAEIESDFVMSIIENEHRQPTFDDAIKYGMRLHKEQIMENTADATIGLPYENKDGGYTHLVDVSRPLPVGDNKIAIIFKED